MSMENLETRQNWSESQNDKFEELLNVVKPMFDSFTSSDEAYETAVKIDDFYNSLKTKGLNPKDYYLWSLLAPDSTSAEAENFDTPDGDIETFIKSLSQSEELELAA